MTQKGFFGLGVISIFFILCGCVDRQANKYSDGSDSLFRDGKHYSTLENNSSKPKMLEVSKNIRVILDSLSQIKIMDSLQSGEKLLSLDGKAHFIIKDTDIPVVIYTGMMKLKSHSVDFQADAYRDSPGQSLKVFKGQLIATKSYKSDFPNTDTLHRGEMILINRDIDLMEKETFDTNKNPSID